MSHPSCQKTTWVLYQHIVTQDKIALIEACHKLQINVDVIDNYHLQVYGCADALLRMRKDASYSKCVAHDFGLVNNQIKARNYLKYRSFNPNVNQNATSYFTPLQLAQIYNFPSGSGAGQKIGIVELGGGYYQSDITTYLHNLGIQTTPNVNAVSVDGAINSPGQDADVEVILDIEIIVALVPSATINVYFAPNSDQGFYDAILRAINDGCKIVSISWGAAENYWSTQSMTAFNNLFQSGTNQGVNIFVACGDNGSGDGESGNHADFPSSSQYVTSCGGTQLTSTNSVRSSEVVWDINPSSNATGGGISAYFSKPAYQSNISLSNNRMVPDLAANASPATGYEILYQGQYTIVGGTSAVAPLMSALFARISQQRGSVLPFINTTLYNNPQVFYDVTQGNNGAYTARVGYDLCSGNGVCIGQSVLALFVNNVVLPTAAFSASPTSGNAPLTVNFTNTSANATSYSWDFGNGMHSTATNPSVVYNTAGNYVVSLSATNSNGTTNVSHGVTVSAVQLPVASFNVSASSGMAPLTVNFTNTSTYATSYLWQLANGVTSTSANTSYTYQTAGTFTVTLTAYNQAGSNSTIRQIVVSAPQIANPVANFSASPTTGNAPLTVTFTNLSTNANTYFWQFGDNNVSTETNPVHRYLGVGNYNVSLRATKNNTNADTLTRYNYIQIANTGLSANFSYEVTSRSRHNVQFINTSTGGATSYQWDFGDLSTDSQVKNPSHRYYRSGMYNVTLTVVRGGQSESVTKQITV